MSKQLRIPAILSALCFATLCLGPLGCGGGDDADGGKTLPDSTGGATNSGGTGGLVLGSGGSTGGGSTGGGTGTGGFTGSYPGPSYAKRIASGDEYNCVIQSDGTLYCWGNGDLPDAESTYKQVVAFEGDVCALRTDGEAECWGLFIEDNIAPGPFEQLTVGGSVACGLRPDGHIVCWGNTVSEIITELPASEVFTAISQGRTTACGLRADGSATCWGNDSGGLNSLVPERNDYDAIYQKNSKCGLYGGGQMDCWGTHGTILPGTGWVQLAAGTDLIVCGLRQDGTIGCAGQDAESAPEGVLFVELSVGSDQMCGITTEGKVKCWALAPEEAYQKDPPVDVDVF